MSDSSPPPRRPRPSGGRPARPGPPRRPEPVDRSLGAPTGAKAPIGIERARARDGAPPRRGPQTAAPPRPDLPRDEEPQLPKGVRREIERIIGRNRRGDDIALALSVGAAAIDEERLDVALPALAWAKHEAPRVAAIREAYGVALYLDEQFAPALSELQAYKRITGKVDQNHLIADCLRALDREPNRVVDAAAALAKADDAPEDRRAEATVIWAATLADTGDIGAGRAVLRNYLDRVGAGRAEHVLRVRYFAGELAERDGDRVAARDAFAEVLAADHEFLDVADRLAALEQA